MTYVSDNCSHDLSVGPDGWVASSEGWAVRPIGPDLLEYCAGSSSCLVNVGYEPVRQARRVYATESTSFLFPRLREHLETATALFKGHYIVV